MTNNTDFSPSWITRVAWFLLALIVVLGAGAFYLFILNRETPVPASWATAGGPRNKLIDLLNVMIQALVFAVTAGAFGALVVSRRPLHPIGWLLCAVGVLSSLSVLGGEWTVYTHYTAAVVPGRGLVAWITNWLWVPLFACVLGILAIFPDGRLQSRRWRWLLSIPFLFFVVPVWLASIVETPMSSAFLVGNPFVETHPARLYSVLFTLGVLFMPLATLMALATVLVRFRQRRGRERQQIKWLLAGVVFMAFMVTVGLTLRFGFEVVLGDYLVNAAFLGPLVGIGVAMLRHRLYDIDLIIRRTLVYSALTGLLALVYFGTVVVLQGLLPETGGERSPAVIVLSTLTIAALFNPLRRRVQIIVDRRFFRSKYDAGQMLADFAAASRNEVELETLTAELLRMVQETMQPAAVSLWLKPTKGGNEPEHSA